MAGETITGTDQNDSISVDRGFVGTIRAGGGDDVIWADGATAEIYGEDGDDYVMFAPLAGRIDGGAGRDHVEYLTYAGDGPAVIDLRGLWSGESEGVFGALRLVSVEALGTVRLTDGADFVVMGNARSSIDRRGDTMIVELMGGDDTYSGSNVATEESISGGDGDDVIAGLAGRDYVGGGEGDDRLFGGAGRDGLYGGAGADILYGSHGADGLHGEDGDDLLYGGVGRDYLSGGAGADAIFGGEGGDRILGGDGDDRIAGGAGRDLLSGEAGADTFAYTRADLGDARRSDRITDFDGAAGDRIDLSAIDADGRGGDTAFAFIGAAAFSGVAGELRAFVREDGMTIVQADVDGDGAADLAIRLEGAPALTAADFIL